MDNLERLLLAVLDTSHKYDLLSYTKRAPNDTKLAERVRKARANWQAAIRAAQTFLKGGGDASNKSIDLLHELADNIERGPSNRSDLAAVIDKQHAMMIRDVIRKIRGIEEVKP